MVSNFVNALNNTAGVLANNMGTGRMAYISRMTVLRLPPMRPWDWTDQVVININEPELLTIASKNNG